MFSMIVVVISIALVALLALATLYFGGSSFSEGGAKAESARVINEAQQLDGAIKAYQAEKQGKLPANIGDLITAEYLKSGFSGTWEFQNDYVVETGLSVDTCVAANKQLGHTFTNDPKNSPVSASFVPDCVDTQQGGIHYGKTVCCKN